MNRDLKTLEQTCGEDVLALTVSRGCLKTLLDNPKVVCCLNGQCPEMLSEFESVAATETP